MYRKSQFEKYVEALDDGRYSTIYTLTGRVDFNRLSRQFSMMVKRRHPDAVYRSFWFRTGDSIAVCYTGNLYLLDAVEDFMPKAVELGIADDTIEHVSGSNKAMFMDVLKNRLSHFTPTPLKRSFGGSRFGQ